MNKIFKLGAGTRSVTRSVPPSLPSTPGAQDAIPGEGSFYSPDTAALSPDPAALRVTWFEDEVQPLSGAGGASSFYAVVYISDTPPADPPDGMMWWDSVGTQLYVRFFDGNSREWVIANNTGGGSGEAGPAGPAGPVGPAGPAGPPGTSGGSSMLLGTGIVADSTVGTTPLPANAVLLNAVVRETAGHAVTVTLESPLAIANPITNGTITVPANGLTMISILSLSQVWFSATATTMIFVRSTAWGGASVNVEIAYQAGP